MDIGTILLAYRVYKNRKILQDYDLWGSALTTLSIAIFQFYFYYVGEIWSVILGVFTLVYWLLVTAYLVMYR